MREIIFRGMTPNGEWVYGDLYRSVDFDEVSIHSHHGRSIRCHVLVGSETVGEYTGFTDRRGERIFEGDIVKDVVFDRNMEVKYEERKGHFSLFRDGTFHGNIATRRIIEVVGNIYDNPELMDS